MAWHTLIEALWDKVVNEEVVANKLETEKPGDPDTNQGIHDHVHICDRKGPYYIPTQAEAEGIAKIFSH